MAAPRAAETPVLAKRGPGADPRGHFSIKVILFWAPGCCSVIPRADQRPEHRGPQSCVGRGAAQPPPRVIGLFTVFLTPKKTMKLCAKPIGFSHMPAEREAM